MNRPQSNPRIPEGINASEENPLKEFAQLVLGVVLALVVAVAIISALMRLLAPYIPFTWEQAMGERLATAFAEVEGEDAGGDEALAALEQLANGLLQTSLGVPIDGGPGDASIPADAFHFQLYDTDQANAFASLGALVVVTQGLLAEVRSENGLAMVIAHEIAHVQLRHPIEAMGRGLLVQLGLSALLGSTGSSLFGGALSSGGMLTMLSFNRDMELAADARALQILRKHYGHLAGADEFFVAMSGQEFGGESGSDKRQAWLEFAQTHPNTERRVALIREAMAQDAIAGTVRPLPAALQSSSDTRSE